MRFVSHLLLTLAVFLGAGPVQVARPICKMAGPWSRCCCGERHGETPVCRLDPARSDCCSQQTVERTATPDGTQRPDAPALVVLASKVSRPVAPLRSLAAGAEPSFRGGPPLFLLKAVLLI